MLRTAEAVFAAEIGTRDLGSGGIAVPTGRSTVNVRSEGGEAVNIAEFAELALHFETKAPYVRHEARIAVQFQDVTLLETTLYLREKFTLVLRAPAFRVPSRLVFNVKMGNEAHHVFEAFDDFSAEPLTCVGVDVTRIADRMGLRWNIVEAAFIVSKTLGLSDDYLGNGRKEALVERIEAYLRDKRPFSLVRVGDGEGRVLGYPEIFTGNEVLNQVLYYQFGLESINRAKRSNPTEWLQSLMGTLRSQLVDALRSADAVGLPVAAYLMENGREKSFGPLGYASGLLMSLPHLQDIGKGDVYGTNLFQMIAEDGECLGRLARAAQEVLLVGPWDLTREIGHAFGVDRIRHIAVPGHHTWRGHAGCGHFPDLYKFVEKEIHRKGGLAGTLALVGAGILGKHYCRLIKDLGGVALDVGSVLDAWAGKGRPEAVANKRIRL